MPYFLRDLVKSTKLAYLAWPNDSKILNNYWISFKYCSECELDQGIVLRHIALMFSNRFQVLINIGLIYSASCNQDTIFKKYIMYCTFLIFSYIMLCDYFSCDYGFRKIIGLVWAFEFFERKLRFWNTHREKCKKLIRSICVCYT